MNAHSRGPWKAASRQPRRVVTDHGITICIVTIENSPGRERKCFEEADANLRILAAALCMRRLLIEMFACDRATPVGEFRERIHDIIARTEGRS